MADAKLFGGIATKITVEIQVCKPPQSVKQHVLAGSRWLCRHVPGIGWHEDADLHRLAREGLPDRFCRHCSHRIQAWAADVIRQVDADQ